MSEGRRRSAGAAVHRRTFLRAAGAGLAGGLGLSAAGCGGSPAPPHYGFNQTIKQADGDVLNSVLDLEYMAISAYELALPALHGANARLGELVAIQEYGHANALTGELLSLGITPRRIRSDFGLTAPRGEREAIRSLSSIENSLIAAYIDALPKLGTPAAREAVASILTSEAEHLAGLDLALGLGPPSSPFAWGRA